MSDVSETKAEDGQDAANWLTPQRERLLIENQGLKEERERLEAQASEARSREWRLHKRAEKAEQELARLDNELTASTRSLTIYDALLEERSEWLKQIETAERELDRTQAKVELADRLAGEALNPAPS